MISYCFSEFRLYLYWPFSCIRLWNSCGENVIVPQQTNIQTLQLVTQYPSSWALTSNSLVLGRLSFFFSSICRGIQGGGVGAWTPFACPLPGRRAPREGGGFSLFYKNNFLNFFFPFSLKFTNLQISLFKIKSIEMFKVTADCMHWIPMFFILKTYNFHLWFLYKCDLCILIASVV